MLQCAKREPQQLCGCRACIFRLLQELPRQPLYRVTFHQAALWEGYTGSSADTLDVEVYQAWLEPASQQDLDHQHEHRQSLHEHGDKHDHGHDHAGHGHQHGEPQVIDHGDHTHEARSVVEQNAVDLEGQDDQERRRLSDALVKVGHIYCKNCIVACCRACVTER